MQAVFDVVQDRSGNAISGAYVAVYNSSNSLAPLFADDGVTPLVNPTITNTDGEYLFYAANGTYRIEITAAGYFEQSIPGVVLFDPANSSFPTSPVSIANGGTGATNAATAAANLNVPTIPVSIANGGTGATNAATAAANLNVPTIPVSIANGGTGATTLETAAANLQGTGLNTNAVGFRTIPQNVRSTNYTTVASDSGGHVFTSTGSITLTIAANSSVAYPIGTAITFVNTNASSVTIAINTDTMTLAGGTSTGNRTLAQNGVATAIKIGTTSWLISGTGLT